MKSNDSGLPGLRGSVRSWEDDVISIDTGAALAGDATAVVDLLAHMTHAPHAPRDRS